MKDIINKKISMLEHSLGNGLSNYLSKKELVMLDMYMCSLKSINSGNYVISYVGIAGLKDYFENDSIIPKRLSNPVKETINQIEHLMKLQNPELIDHYDQISKI